MDLVGRSELAVPGRTEHVFICNNPWLYRLFYPVSREEIAVAIPWTKNIFFVQHLPPAEHPSFFSSSRLTLNVTRSAMREMGWCPSGRLFEAAACGTPIISDWWEGLDEFFVPESEIFIATSAEDVLAALQSDDAQLSRIADAARERVLAEHTGAQRAVQFEEIIERVQPHEMAAA